MFEWPTLVMMIVTYDRLEELKKTVTELHNLVHYPMDKQLWVIADDCTPGDYKENIIQFWQDSAFPTRAVIVSPPQNGGWAVNVNTALRQFRDYTVYFQEEDYLPTQPIDLMAGVALLNKTPHLGMLRYRGSAGMRCTYHQNETDISDLYPDYWNGQGSQRITYLELDPNSPALYLYSHGPSLRKPVFHQYYGEYIEGYKLGATEEIHAHVVKDKMQNENAPRIAILPDFVEMRYVHIGKSYQHTDLDKGKGV